MSNTAAVAATAGTAPGTGTPAVAPARIASIDALRGFDMLCIVSIYRIGLALGEMLSGQGPVLTAVGDFITRQFQHAPWEGLRFYDLLYPLFLFIVGVVIPLSIARLVEREGKTAAHWRILQRSAVLILLGFLYYGGFDNHWPDIRLLGV
ncbi:MAG: DUF5009 domain-containing protein, partial [Alphaproteobacteria bacterium]